MYERDQSLWRQYGTEKVIRLASGNNMIKEMIPANMWGHLRTKVTAVSRFRNTIQRRQEMAQYLQNVWPQFKEIAGPAGNREMGVQVSEMFGVRNVQNVFPSLGDWDAEARARHENYMVFEFNQDIRAQAGENHIAHNKQHKPALRRAELLPKEPELDKQIVILKRHILEHDTFMEQAPGAGRTPEAFNELRSPTQEAGEQLEAAGGATA
jgi:hypothetical protein